MAKLTRGRWCVLLCRCHVDNRSSILVKTVQNAEFGGLALNPCNSITGVHFACFAFDTDLFRRDEIRLEVTTPFQCTLDSLFGVIDLPFRRTHITRDGVCALKPALLPRVIGVGFREQFGVGILKTNQDRMNIVPVVAKLYRGRTFRRASICACCSSVYDHSGLMTVPGAGSVMSLCVIAIGMTVRDRFLDV
jgi:hypothetical protein